MGTLDVPGLMKQVPHSLALFWMRYYKYKSGHTEESVQEQFRRWAQQQRE